MSLRMWKIEILGRLDDLFHRFNIDNKFARWVCDKYDDLMWQVINDYVTFD